MKESQGYEGYKGLRSSVKERRWMGRTNGEKLLGAYFFIIGVGIRVPGLPRMSDFPKGEQKGSS